MFLHCIVQHEYVFMFIVADCIVIDRQIYFSVLILKIRLLSVCFDLDFLASASVIWPHWLHHVVHVRKTCFIWTVRLPFTSTGHGPLVESSDKHVSWHLLAITCRQTPHGHSCTGDYEHMLRLYTTKSVEYSWYDS